MENIVPPGVRYEMVYEGKVVDVVAGGKGDGTITQLIGRVERNPGMTIKAVLFDKRTDETISARTVYPVPSAG